MFSKGIYLDDLERRFCYDILDVKFIYIMGMVIDFYIILFTIIMYYIVKSTKCTLFKYKLSFVSDFIGL